MTITADQFAVLPPDGRTAPMPNPAPRDPGGQVRHPLGPDAPVAPRPGAPAATPVWPFGPETRPAPVIGNRPVPMPGNSGG
jgi:hypothetical protein